MKRYKFEFLVIVFFTSLLFLTFLLPDHYQKILVLDKAAFGFWQILLHSYVHEEINHFLSNLIIFIILFLLGAIIAKNSSKEKEFYKYFAILLVLVPIFTGTVFYLWVPLQTMRGISDIVCSLLGLTLYFSLIYFNQGSKIIVDLRSIKTTIFIFVFLLTIFLAVFVEPFIVAGICAFEAGLFLILKVFKNYSLSQIVSERKKFVLLFIVLVLVCCFPVLVQVKFTSSGWLDGLSHFYGFYLGFTTPFFLQQLSLLKNNWGDSIGKKKKI